MQCGDDCVEFGAVVGNLVDGSLPFPGRPLVDIIERLLELREDVGLAGLVRVELKAERLKPDLLETAMDDVERGLLLGDEEHLASVREVVGDQVRDRLRLACSGRTVQDERLAHRGVEDGGELGRVCGKRSEQLAVLDVRADFLGRKHLYAVVVVSAALHEMRDEWMCRELVGARREVLPHHELAEREVPERSAFLDRPVGECLHPLAECLQHLRDGDAGIVFGERIESVDLDAELGLQELDERRVEFGVFIEAREDISFADVLAR